MENIARITDRSSRVELMLVDTKSNVLDATDAVCAKFLVQYNASYHHITQQQRRHTASLTAQFLHDPWGSDLTTFSGAYQYQEAVKSNLLLDVTILWDRYNWSTQMIRSAVLSSQHNPSHDIEQVAPINSHSQYFSVPFYNNLRVLIGNKALLARVGVHTREDFPQTWDAFLDMNDRLVAEGIAPISIRNRAGNVKPWPVFSWVTHLILRRYGLEFYYAFVSGEVRWTSDEIHWVFMTLVDMRERGHFDIAAQEVAKASAMRTSVEGGVNALFLDKFDVVRADDLVDLWLFPSMAPEPPWPMYGHGYTIRMGISTNAGNIDGAWRFLETFGQRSGFAAQIAPDSPINTVFPRSNQSLLLTRANELMDETDVIVAGWPDDSPVGFKNGIYADYFGVWWSLEAEGAQRTALDDFLQRCDTFRAETFDLVVTAPVIHVITELTIKQVWERWTEEWVMNVSAVHTEVATAIAIHTESQIDQETTWHALATYILAGRDSAVDTFVSGVYVYAPTINPVLFGGDIASYFGVAKATAGVKVPYKNATFAHVTTTTTPLAAVRYGTNSDSLLSATDTPESSLTNTQLYIAPDADETTATAVLVLQSRAVEGDVLHLTSYAERHTYQTSATTILRVETEEAPAIDVDQQKKDEGMGIIEMTTLIFVPIICATLLAYIIYKGYHRVRSGLEDDDEFLIDEGSVVVIAVMGALSDVGTDIWAYVQVLTDWRATFIAPMTVAVALSLGINTMHIRALLQTYFNLTAEQEAERKSLSSPIDKIKKMVSRKNHRFLYSILSAIFEDAFMGAINLAILFTTEFRWALAVSAVLNCVLFCTKVSTASVQIKYGLEVVKRLSSYGQAAARSQQRSMSELGTSFMGSFVHKKQETGSIQPKRIRPPSPCVQPTGIDCLSPVVPPVFVLGTDAATSESTDRNSQLVKESDPTEPIGVEDIRVEEMGDSDGTPEPVEEQPRGRRLSIPRKSTSSLASLVVIVGDVEAQQQSNFGYEGVDHYIATNYKTSFSTGDKDKDEEEALERTPSPA